MFSSVACIDGSMGSCHEMIAPDHELTNSPFKKSKSSPQQVTTDPLQKNEPKSLMTKVIWAFRLLIDWATNGMLNLFWIRISTRLWLLAVRYRQHCLRSRVALAILLPLPAGLLLSLILFSTDMCLVMSEDDP